jgi:hypothetical protein
VEIEFIRNDEGGIRVDGMTGAGKNKGVEEGRKEEGGRD